MTRESRVNCVMSVKDTPRIFAVSARTILQPTALLHEAYLRLVGQRRVAWRNRGQFFGLAAQMMRRITPALSGPRSVRQVQ